MAAGMSERRNITRSTGILGLATSLSRVGGLVRDMVIASQFGAGFATDAFFMAFTLPNLLRRFFAEGSLTAAFVPIFSEVYLQQGREEARRVANLCWSLLLIVMLGVTLLGILGSPLLVRLIGFGFEDIPGKLQLTDQLNRVMFPYILFASLLALATGILNVSNHYFLPAVSPLILNLTMIASALLLTPLFAKPVMALAVGVLLGGALQLLLQLPVLKRHGFSPGLAFAWRNPSVRRISRLMLPGIAGVAIYQINVIVTRLLASFLPQGSVSYLYYGQRLFEFPQGIFIVSLAQAVLPAMSRQAAVDDHEGLAESLRFALALIVVVTLPAAVGLLLCAKPIYSLLFMYGAFDADAVQQTALALAAYAPGLLFVGISRVVVPTFYALKDTRTPVLVSFWTLLVNAGLGLLLMGPLRHVGLALALTLSALFNCVALTWLLRRRLGSFGLGSVAATLLRSLPPLLGMSVVVWWLLGQLSWNTPGLVLEKGLLLGFAILVGIAVYAGGCVLFRVREAAEAWSLIRRKLGRKR